ncbi:MAG: hypothetical protein ACLTDV_03655 [Eubacterium sp.]
MHITFIYSKRTGTPAAKMEDQVPEDVVKVRFDRLLKEVQEIAAEKSAVLTGRITGCTWWRASTTGMASQLANGTSRQQQCRSFSWKQGADRPDHSGPSG